MVFPFVDDECVAKFPKTKFYVFPSKPSVSQFRFRRKTIPKRYEFRISSRFELSFLMLPCFLKTCLSLLMVKMKKIKRTWSADDKIQRFVETRHNNSAVFLNFCFNRFQTFWRAEKQRDSVTIQWQRNVVFRSEKKSRKRIS